MQCFSLSKDLIYKRLSTSHYTLSNLFTGGSKIFLPWENTMVRCCRLAARHIPSGPKSSPLKVSITARISRKREEIRTFEVKKVKNFESYQQNINQHSTPT